MKLSCFTAAFILFSAGALFSQQPKNKYTRYCIPACMTVEEYNLNGDTSITGTKLDSLNSKLKDVWLAAYLAIVPGVIFRGIGHIYAGKYLTWAGLTITTCVSIYLFDKEDDYLPDEGDDLTDKKFKLYDRFHYSALILFFGSWAYDIIGAPIACISYNKRIKESLSLKPYFARNQWGSRIGIQLCCNF